MSIRVEDVNDNVPVFSPLLYNASFAESEVTESGIALLQVTATDDDEDDFGRVSFECIRDFYK